MRYLLLSLTLLGTGCATAGPGDYCRIASPIYLDRADQFTDRTARALLTHNETYAKLCG